MGESTKLAVVLAALLVSGQAAASDETSEGLDDVEAVWALEAEMLEDLLVPVFDERDVGGPYEGLVPLSGAPGLRSVTDVPRAGLMAEPIEGAGEGAAPRSALADPVEGALIEETDESLEMELDVELRPAITRFDLTGIEPVFGLDTLDHDPIHTYLEFWTGRGRRRLARLLARSGRYAELIQGELREAGLPEELLYLVMIESGFDTGARSRAAAVGLWQFMARTGRGYGLEIGRRYDERRDPEAATAAAIEYLSSLYERFGSWPLAMAGYNAGGGHVRGELRRYNVNDFWRMDDYSCVYDDTRRYVYMIVTAAIIGENPERFGFDGIVPEEPARYETVDVPGSTRLSVYARAADTDVDTLLDLNPALLAASTPDVETYALHLPEGSLDDFMASYDRYVLGEEGDAFVHTVRIGERIDDLAELFGLPERVLRAANGLSRGEEPEYGSDVVVPLHPDDAERALDSWPGPAPDPDDDALPVVITPPLRFVYPDREPVYYEVRHGDELATVAGGFGVTVWDLAMWNDLDPDAVLHTEMTLQVFPGPSADLSGVRYLPASHVRALPLGSPEYLAWDEAEETRRRSRRRTYTVRRGDTISRIARRFGVSSRDLMRWNDIDDPHRIRAGQRLRVR